ncbi:Putative ribosomal protein S5 domain 2-type [Septoria linicola]|uniref:Phosphomevalonate kinase n=1 Tax=Septoria linicola TaxID=215465 RepID=A0A9Q9B2F6_9PEZI|nr:putative ribosomal protein S5 domain 2-type [Septoria linicola]USW56965.1 Putative ribosomal protein S5 domain 2-type [Septoria linicola]
MASSMYSPVAVSAPGKVLLAGGYLVLDRAHKGLVFGLDARIHVLIEDIPTSKGIVLNEIVVKSPQFLDAVWEYGYRLTERNGGVQVTQLRVDADLNLNRNPFIETTIAYVLSYITSISHPNITPAAITILADNDYYSTPAAISNGTNDGSKPRFHNFGLPISKAPKTGLGSSAALVTSVTAALLTYYLPRAKFDLTHDSGKKRLHNLAQAAHCAAQGKVGSGFDVASAVYGTMLYRRFSPKILASHANPGTPKFGAEIRDIVDETFHGGEWDTEILKDQVRVPKGLRLVMCDVSCGSKTPGMVKQVLAWRAEKKEEANAIWKDLDEANEALAAELKAVAEAGSGDYAKLSEKFTRIRQLIRLMSEKSGVPIEPPAQTELLDACERVAGVVGGVVPGAGGYDAISLLIEDKLEVVQALEKLFAGWDFKGEGEGGGKVSMMGVREEMEGVKLEDPKSYISAMEEL